MIDEEIYDKLKNNKITNLELCYTSININKLNKYLYFNTSLIELRFFWGIIKNIDTFNCLKYNSSLNIINLEYNEIKNIDKLGEYLKYNSSLTKLWLGGNEIENINILNENLKFNTSLKELDLRYNKIKNINKNKLDKRIIIFN